MSDNRVRPKPESQIYNPQACAQAQRSLGNFTADLGRYASHLEEKIERLRAEVATAKENLAGWERMRESYYHLEGLLAEKDKRIEELENALDYALPPITEADIDKAWHICPNEIHDGCAEMVLEPLGIVACEKCGGSGEGDGSRDEYGYAKDCPSCGGHGWVWKGVSDAD